MPIQSLPPDQAQVGDFIEAWISCSKRSKASQVPRRGQITEIAGPILRFTGQSHLRFVCMRSDVIKAWRFRDEEENDSNANPGSESAIHASHGF